MSCRGFGTFDHTLIGNQGQLGYDEKQHANYREMPHEISCKGTHYATTFS